jgi:lysophospholipase L1-like esterase
VVQQSLDWIDTDDKRGPALNALIDTLVLKHKPRLVVFYSGDNDVQSGKSANTVFADFKTFTENIREALPETRIAIISIKPSVARWEKVGPMRKVNDMLRAFAMERNYVDIEGTMLGWDGTPNPDLLVEDGLHVTPAGYKI